MIMSKRDSKPQENGNLKGAHLQEGKTPLFPSAREKTNKTGEKKGSNTQTYY